MSASASKESLQDESEQEPAKESSSTAEKLSMIPTRSRTSVTFSHQVSPGPSSSSLRDDISLLDLTEIIAKILGNEEKAPSLIGCGIKQNLPRWLVVPSLNQLEGFMEIDPLLSESQASTGTSHVSESPSETPPEGGEEKPTLEDIVPFMDYTEMIYNPSDVESSLNHARGSRLPFEEFMCSMAQKADYKSTCLSVLVVLRWPDMLFEMSRLDKMREVPQSIEFEMFLEDGDLKARSGFPDPKPEPPYKSPYDLPLQLITTERDMPPSLHFRTREARGPLVLGDLLHRKKLIKVRGIGKPVEYSDDNREANVKLKMLARSGNPMAKIPGMASILNALVDVMVEAEIVKRRAIIRAAPSIKRANRLSIGKSQIQWMIIRMNSYQTALPLPYSKCRYITYTEVDDFRQQRDAILRKYYSMLKRIQIVAAWEHWKTMKIESFKTSQSRTSFAATFQAYTPCDEKNSPVKMTSLREGTIKPQPKRSASWIPNF